MAPTVAGIIMSYSHIIAAIFIAVWNLVSVFCEYALLRRVYKLVPELAVKGVNAEDGRCFAYDSLMSLKFAYIFIYIHRVNSPHLISCKHWSFA